MARYRDLVGYVSTAETSPGVFTPVKEEKIHSGYLINDSRRYESSYSGTDGIALANRLSIICSDEELNNASYIRYVTIRGKRWQVTSFVVERPRVILTLGGLYNG